MKTSRDLFGRIRNWVLPENNVTAMPVTNNDLLKELLECFYNSCATESVGSSLLFNMHFLVILHPDTYEQRLPSLPVLVKEAVKLFYRKLQGYQNNYEELSPVSAHWQFRFGPATDFNQERVGPHEVRVIGMLTGLRSGQAPAEAKSASKVTMKSKLTNAFDKMDLNLELLKHIHFADSGSFTVKFSPDLSLNGGSLLQQARNLENGFARIDYYLGDQHIHNSFIMRDTEIVIARKEAGNQGYSNYLLLDSPYVSNPHARIRLNEQTGKFQIASFSARETRVNEQVITRSEAADPRWFELPAGSQLLLNGIITLDFKPNS
ncbi:MAG: hypothetical protein P0Y53_14085 [Candidatus Pseudobacter hemicellulosilyticus]|uniref:FHA domain-containing protein n=1 Tax=Candidatus Pseudobacter hemicellulosilyticus TaxID=3121375 RepID=A0AAJ5WPZ6_9BACT|nr:MAG: hypothetical protein P0Y53_14085 [Pseudobacter sp.]